MNQVLLVGEAVGWLEVDLIPFGMACASAPTATSAVEMLKNGLAHQQPWHSIVVGSNLPDMTGPAFVDGLMRHFDPASVVLVADVEPHIAQHLTSSPKVRIFPGATGGGAIAEHLFRRLGGGQASPPPPPQGMVGGNGLAGLAGLFEQPAAPPPPASFGPGTPPPFVAPGPGASWGGPQGQPRSPTATTMPFFAALGQNNGQVPAPSQPPSPTSMPPSPSPSPPPSVLPTTRSSVSMPPMVGAGPDRATLQRLESLAEELASANADVASLKSRAQTAEARAFEAAQKAFEREAQNAALAAELGEVRTELDLVRHAARNEAENELRRRAELDQTQTQLAALQEELEPLRAAAAGLEQAVADLAGLQAAVQERDQALEDARRVVDQVSAQHHADVTALNAHIMTLGETLAAHEQNAAVRDAELQGAVNRLNVLDAQLVDAARIAAELEATRTALTEQQAGNELQVESLRAQLLEAGAVAATVEGLQRELDALRTAREESEAAWAREQQKVTTLEEKLAEAQASTADLEDKRAEAQASTTALEEKLAEAQAATTALEEKLAEALAGAADKQAQLAVALAGAADQQAQVAALQVEREKLKMRLEAGALADLQIQALTEARDGLVERAAAAEARVIELEQQLTAARASESNSKIDELKVAVDEAERFGAFETERADRAVNDAVAVRKLLESTTHEQARLVAEIEQLRPIATEVEKARAAMVDMQRQLEAALGTDDAEADTGAAIQEAVRARTREILELARAIEPFSWGLDQAAAFFGEVPAEGAQRHVQSLRLLQATLGRLKVELDRLHT